MRTYRRAIIVSTSVLIAGVAASLAGNLQAINLDNHRPGIGAYISAVIWPVFLFAAIEVLLHTPWLASWRDRLTKGLAVAMVGGVAAYVSYFHLAHVLSSYGYDVASRYAGPLAIDACMAMATLALNRVGHARRAVDVDTVSTDTLPDGTVVDIADGKVVGIGRTVDKREYSPVDEANSYLARLAQDMDSTTTPAYPIESGGPAPAPQRAPRASVAINQDEALQLALTGVRESDYGLVEISKLLGGYYGVDGRTIRRQAWWPMVSAARPVSAAPAND